VGPVAVTALLSPAEVAELRAVQEELRAALRQWGRPELLPVVDNQVYGAIEATDATGFVDARLLDRFHTLMQRSRFSGAVVVRLDGRST
jgi:hypothetical protein